MNPKKVLITGANGFVGSNLYDALSGEFHLIGLDIAGPGKYPPEDFYRWEQMKSLPPVYAIIHLAGKAHDTACTSREQEYFDVNLGLTQKIFDHFLQSVAEKFIFFSSVKAVADSVRGEWLTEMDEPDPRTPYGRSKLAAERYILERLIQNPKSFIRHSLDEGGPNPQSEIRNPQSAILDHRSLGEGSRNPQSPIRNPKSVYILRPAMIHGPGNKGNLNLLYKVVSKGIPWPLGSFDNQRSFASVGNVAFVVREIIDRDITPGIYQVADDEPVSTSEIVGMIADSRGKKPVVWHLSRGVIGALVRIGDILRLPLNSERLKKLTENYRVANTKLKGALGITKMPVASKEGLIRTFSSFRRR